jgi:hypothetical protein
MIRRGFLLGLLAAPAIIRTPGLLMPVRPFLIIEPLISANQPMWQFGNDELISITHRALVPKLFVQMYQDNQLLKMLANGGVEGIVT